MLFTEYNEEECIKTWQEDGFVKGLAEETHEAARNFYANGASVELIAKSLNMTVEQVMDIVKDVVVAQA